MMTMLFLGCIATTGGQRVSFDGVATPVATVVDNALSYDDAATGWHVELTTAKVSVGPAYLWSGEPLLTTTARWSPLDLLGRTAEAHTIDHFSYGYLRGEILEQAAVDLLADDEVAIGPGDGIAGEAKSSELWLTPPEGDVASALGGETFTVAGSATKESVTIPFAGTLTITDDVIDVEGGQTTFEQQKVRGIPLDAEVADGGTFVVGIDATRLLAGADFADLLAATPDDDGTYAVTYGTTVWAIFYYQVRQSGDSGPWRLSWRQ